MRSRAGERQHGGRVDHVDRPADVGDRERRGAGVAVDDDRAVAGVAHRLDRADEYVPPPRTSSVLRARATAAAQGPEHVPGMLVVAIDDQRELERHVVVAQPQSLAQPVPELERPRRIGVPPSGCWKST